MASSQSPMKFCVANERYADDLSLLHGDLFADGWSEADFINFIRSENDTVLICTWGEMSELAGFAVVRQVYDEAEILSIGVARSRQRSGLGFDFYCNLEKYLLERKATRIFLELRKSNATAAGLYEKAGFKLVATRKDYYRSSGGMPKEDALIMKKDL